MESNMILSASGWRKVFAQSGNENDESENIGSENEKLVALIAETFSQYLIKKTKKKSPSIVLARDTRPTGKSICKIMVKVFCHFGIRVQYLKAASAPEIMAYSKKFNGFCYVSASHNPIGHNGFKFGLNEGGVINAGEAKILADDFKERLEADNAEEHAKEILSDPKDEKECEKILKESQKAKEKSLLSYTAFIKEVITGSKKEKDQEKVFKVISNYLSKNPIDIVCDMNGSARSVSIDKSFLPQRGLGFIAFNDQEGQIVHEIIPEPENLVYAQKKMTELQNEGNKNAILAYMPDCDGDRGNLVYWDEKSSEAKIIKAQEIFALCVMAETAYGIWKADYLDDEGFFEKRKKTAICVNCPTSMRIEEIAKAFGAKVFRAEVGEANVVNLAREKRNENYKARIFGEGSNGGNITFPSSVRDPLSSVFAIVKLLSIRDTIAEDGSLHKGLFHIWCEKSDQEEKYKKDFSLQDIFDSLPVYTTTGVSEERAVLKIQSSDKGLLKERFRLLFEKSFKEKKDFLFKNYGIKKYHAFITNGTKEAKSDANWNNANGGLKIIFYDEKKEADSFIWMRPSGTENVFRIMCDVKGDKKEKEAFLLSWESSLIKEADSEK